MSRFTHLENLLLGTLKRVEDYFAQRALSRADAEMARGVSTAIALAEERDEQPERPLGVRAQQCAGPDANPVPDLGILLAEGHRRRAAKAEALLHEAEQKWYELRAAVLGLVPAGVLPYCSVNASTPMPDAMRGVTREWYVSICLPPSAAGNAPPVGRKLVCPTGHAEWTADSDWFFHGLDDEGERTRFDFADLLEALAEADLRRTPAKP